MRGSRLTSSMAPTAVMGTIVAIRGQKRRIVGAKAPRWNDWKMLATRVGSASRTTAVWRSTARVRSGIATMGRPSPATPLVKPPTNSAAAQISAVLTSSPTDSAGPLRGPRIPIQSVDLGGARQGLLEHLDVELGILGRVEDHL